MKSATDVERLVGYAKGEVVELPPFVEGERFFARLKRPSLIGLAARGVIPNGLMKAAAGLFGGKAEDGKNESGFKGQCEVFEVMAREALIEPTWEQLDAIGLALTDEQVMAVFGYTQRGVKALEPFRGKRAGAADNKDVRSLGHEAERGDAD